MAAQLGSRAVDPSSPYRAALETVRAQDVARLATAGDPDQVAAAVEACLASPEPPARVVVGADAEGFEKLVRESTPDAFAKMLQDYVAQLAAAGQSAEGE